MALLTASTIIPYESNLGRDVAVNTWHFSTQDGDPDTDDFEAIRERLEDFFNGTAHPDALEADQFHPVCYYLADYLQPSAARIKIRQPGVEGDPLYDEAMDVDSQAAGQPLPFECAVVVSEIGGFQLDGTAPTIPKRRRRARQYIGPLNILALGEVSNQPRVSTGFQYDLSVACIRLAELSSVDLAWVTWSATQGGSAGIHIINEGFVNAEFDTQRRRQLRDPGRITWLRSVFAP